MSAKSLLRNLALLAALLAIPAASASPGPTLHFTQFAQTDLPLSQVLWTGTEWLYIGHDTGQIEAANADGSGVRPFATVAPGGEELRCAVPPNALWPPGI